MARKVWTEEEIECLKLNYNKLQPSELENIFGRNWVSIKTKASKLGIKSGRFWTQWEIEFLKENYSKYSIEVISKEINKSDSSIRRKAYKLGLTNEIDFWDEDDTNFLITNFYVLTDEEIANILLRSKKSIAQKRNTLGLFRRKRNKLFSKDDDEFISENYKYMTDKEISLELDRDDRAIFRRRTKLNLKKDCDDIIMRSREEWVKNNTKSKLIEDSYKDIHDDHNFICNCGNKFKRSFHQFKNKEYYSCKECRKLKFRIDNHENDFKNFYEKFKKVAGEEFVLLSNYINSKTPIMILHNECGKIMYKQNWNTFNQRIKCTRCSSNSKWEDYIESLLVKYSVDYECEYTFGDCFNPKTGSLLRFDFCIFNKNAPYKLIEYDGVHHFEEIYGKGTLVNTQYRDSIKNKFCNEYNLYLVRIPYFKSNMIEEILYKELKDIIEED